MNKTIVACAKCGIEFHRPNKYINRAEKLGRVNFFCSKACSGEFHKKPEVYEQHKCESCGESFTRKASSSYLIKCCSKKCANRISRGWKEEEKVSVKEKNTHSDLEMNSEIDLSSKQKGNVASSLVTLQLQRFGFNVFSEIGDFSKIDLIAEKDSKITRIQVKYISRKNTEKNDTTELWLRKSGPNGYRYTYTINDVDWFAVFDPVTEQIAWISSKEACGSKASFSLSFSDKIGSRLFSDYSFKNFLSSFLSSNEFDDTLS